MEKKIKISIVIPVYNNEKFLPKAIESVLDQDFQDFEIVIVDDGSTDRTGEIADAFALQDNRIKVVHQKNQWIYASFNRGINESNGEYIYILNSDDKFRPNVLGYLYEMIQKYHPDVVWTKILTHECDSEQKILKYDITKVGNGIKKEYFFSTQEDVRGAWISLEKNSIMHNQANLYRRELMIKHPFRNDVYGADLFFNIDIAPDINSAVLIDLAVYDHYMYGETINTSKKFYSYKNDMFNEFHDRRKALYETFNIDKGLYEYDLARNKIQQVSMVIRQLSHIECDYTIERKLELVFTEYIDDVVLNYAKNFDAEEELECRVLSGAREILLRESLAVGSEMYFVHELLDSLLRYEKDEEDYYKIESAINHVKNPYRIGKVLFNKLTKKQELS